MKTDLVITRFNENLNWINKITNPDVNIVVYNKGDDIHYDNAKIIKTLNIGRESYGYINYIIENYNNLPEYILFLQGEPFEHCINENLRKYGRENDIEFATNRKLYADPSNPNKWEFYYKINQIQLKTNPYKTFEHGAHNDVRPINLMNYINTGKFQPDILGDCIVHGSYPYDPSFNSIAEYFKNTDKYQIFNKLYEEVSWMAGAQFCVHKNQILYYDISLYKEILALYTKYNSICHALEKIYFYMFFTNQGIIFNE